jgi:hypothetical protein
LIAEKHWATHAGVAQLSLHDDTIHGLRLDTADPGRGLARGLCVGYHHIPNGFTVPISRCDFVLRLLVSPSKTNRPGPGY